MQVENEKKSDEKVITAVGAIIINEAFKMLIAKRPYDKPMPFKWEFPGGKLEENESLEKCCVREIKEELSVDIDVQEYLGYEDIVYKSKTFCLHFFIASMKDEHQDIKLNEHDEVQWVGIEDFERFDFPASKLPIIKQLKKTLSKKISEF